MRLGDKVVEKSLSKTGGRGYAGLLCCISFAHKLLTSGETATMRAMYYYYKGGAWSPWQSQLECNESIADAAALFGVERHELGFKSTPKGFVAGRLRIDDNPSLDDTPQTIGHDWMTKARKIRSNARCVSLMCPSDRELTLPSSQILVVEKDGVFQRLVTDRFFDKYPCVLVTGVGVPDMPTRACVSYIQKALGHIPVYLVVDWNPWGLAIVLCYKFGSARLGIESQKYAINQARWLGIREAFLQGSWASLFAQARPRLSH